MKFNRLNPSSVYFDTEILVKEKIEKEYFELEKGIGYWVTECPFVDGSFEKFKTFVNSNPIWRMNNEPEFEDTNPFATIHLATFATDKINKLISNIYGPPPYRTGFNDWGNLYWKDECRPIKRWRLPHRDYGSGLVANLWFTDHTETETGTRIFKYKGKEYGVNYDFHVDSEHPLYNEWHSMGAREREERFTNFSDEEALYWGFEPLGMAPTKYSCMTMYHPNISHTPYIEDSVDFRWSHTFATFAV